MTSELEKEYLEDLDHYDEGMGIHSTSYEKCKERLIRLAKIDNAKPSEALERLENNRNAIPYAIDYRIIKQALIKSQEQEKVLEIIKEKKVDIKLIMWAGNMVEAYNQKVREQKDYWWREELTQEEFDLLKRWFK